jgi:hypothetical protein
MIWKYALPEQRIIEVEFIINDLLRPEDMKISHAPLLNLIRVCKEASLVVEESYQKVEIRFLGQKCVLYFEQYFLVDYKRDIFYFPQLLLSESWSSDYTDVANIRIVAFGLSCFGYETEENFNQMCRHHMKNLREVLFVHDQRAQPPERKYQGDGRPLFSTEASRDRDQNYLNIYGDTVQEIEDALAVPTIAENYQNVRISYAIFRPSVLAQNPIRSARHIEQKSSRDVRLLPFVNPETLTVFRPIPLSLTEASGAVLYC